MTSFRPMFQKMLDILSEAQTHRHERDHWVGGELEWIKMEQQSMLEAVNEEREKLRRVKITMEDLIRVEQTAVGHSDYSRKFAAGCARLVLDQPQPVD